MAKNRLQAATLQKKTLESKVQDLTSQQKKKKKAASIAEKEEVWLQERKTLRMQQQELLQKRLDTGWDDE